ncbi:hypothetical protein AAVH_33145 [Aphelenchoides avenae]|nr:hypothetical protein AAVH_33145 [Aphelenchus avenae]
MPILKLSAHDPHKHVAAIEAKEPNLGQVKLQRARALLTLKIDSGNNLGLAWSQACLQLHTSGTRCSGRTLGGSLYSFDEHSIQTKIPRKYHQTAFALSRMPVSSLIQHVLVHWAGRVDDNDARKYELLRRLCWAPKPENRQATPPEALATVERFCTEMENYRENLPTLGALMIREAVRSFVAGCLVTKTAIGRAKNVGPIQIRTETDSLSPFQKALVDFVNLHLPEALDAERATVMDKTLGRHAKDHIRSIYACTQVVYLGDSIASALAHRNKVSASYLELYTFKELQLALDFIYLNREVETVFISVGRTDINDYYASGDQSTYRVQMDNFTETLKNNFPHVRVVWIHPTIVMGTDPDQELYSPVWDQHINAFSGDTYYDDLSTEPANERLVECKLPTIMSDLAPKQPEFQGLTEKEVIEKYQDSCGNLTMHGVKTLIWYFKAAYGLDYWYEDEETPITLVQEVRVPASHQWKVKAPAGQTRPPVGGKLRLVPFRRVPSPLEFSMYPTTYSTETPKVAPKPAQTGPTEQQAPRFAAKPQRPIKSLFQQTQIAPKPSPVQTPMYAPQRPISGASTASYSTASSSRRSSSGFQDDFGSFFSGPNTAYTDARPFGKHAPKPATQFGGSAASSTAPSQAPTPTPPRTPNLAPKPQQGTVPPASTMPLLNPAPTVQWPFLTSPAPPGFNAPAPPGSMGHGWYTYPSLYGAAPMPGMPYYQLQPQNLQQPMGTAPTARQAGQLPPGGIIPPAVTTAPTAASAPAPQQPVHPAQQPPPPTLSAEQMAAA